MPPTPYLGRSPLWTRGRAGPRGTTACMSSPQCEDSPGCIGHMCAGCCNLHNAACMLQAEREEMCVDKRCAAICWTIVATIPMVPIKLLIHLRTSDCETATAPAWVASPPGRQSSVAHDVTSTSTTWPTTRPVIRSNSPMKKGPGCTREPDWASRYTCFGHQAIHTPAIALADHPGILCGSCSAVRAPRHGADLPRLQAYVLASHRHRCVCVGDRL